MGTTNTNRSFGLRRSTLAAALAIGLGFTGMSFAQSTTGAIFGQAPAAAGETITVTNESGFNRQIPVDASGRYSLNSLPTGTYTVKLERDGKVVDSRDNVTLRVGAGTEVSFTAAAAASGEAQSLEGVSVTANALPAIDVSSVDSRTVITSQELARLPLARTAEGIALLAPGAVAGSSFFTGPTGNALVSINGSAVTENAYYINGFNTTDPLSGFGGISLPYGAIDQQEVLAGGYGAAYGRSSGGVISQVGKRGTNDWHFGGQVLWEPKFAKEDPRDFYYAAGDDVGKINNKNSGDKAWVLTEDAYVGGPLIKDKLFIFAAVEGERREGNSTGSVNSPFKTDYRYDNPKWYSKLDWNITDSNILEITAASAKQSYSSSLYDYDYDTNKTGAFSSFGTSTKNGADLYTAKFTSYITDDLTLTALYGKMKGTYYTESPGSDPSTPHIITPDNQNPDINGGAPISNSQALTATNDPAHTSTNTNLRIDLVYRIGDHQIAAGIDNQQVGDFNDGSSTTGPGYAWEYDIHSPNSPIVGKPGADPFVDATANYPNGQGGYYVAKYINGNSASVRTTQRAQYIEDTWQVNDQWLLKIGLRNDQFTNYNQAGIPFLRLTKPQWAPRIGFTWDVNGDSSFKVYGNAGRYFLAMPASVALRSAGSSLYTREYFTYSGIDAQGIPQGLTPIATSTGGPLSVNREYGIPRDPKTAASKNLQSEYQDEYILGFDKKLNDAWVYGVKGTVRKLRSTIDDVGDSDAIFNKMVASGIDPATIGAIQGSYLFNPGRTNTFEIPNLNGGYYNVNMSNKDFGFPAGTKRNYYSLETYLEHSFDGKWWAKIDYLYSRSYGNSEGQVRSDISQDDVSATVDWDYAQLMDYSNGELANNRKHQLKIFGTYQLTAEWLFSGNILIASGAPRSCLGYYGADGSNPGLGYGPYYHYCDGTPSRPGDAGHNPWQKLVTVNAEYRPSFADHKLAFNVSIFNLFNQRQVTQINPIYGSADAVEASYKLPLYQTTPRYARFGVTYDF